MRAITRNRLMRSESEYSTTVGTDLNLRREVEYEQVCWDPKDGELYLGRVKPGETLVEARSDTDVQIVRLIWIKGRKTNRTI